MKKLLLLATLATMTTTAMAVEYTALTTDKAEAKVEVRAEIVEDAFTITDIYGQPLVLDFGKIQKKTGGVRAVASVDYKINAKDNLANEATFTMTIGGTKTEATSQTTNVTLTNTTAVGTDTLTATVTLAEKELVMEKGKNIARGTIGGKLDTAGTEEVGVYGGFTTLFATVSNVK